MQLTLTPQEETTTPDTHPAAGTRQTIDRTASLGSHYLIDVEHQGDGTVKILSWKRKRKGDTKHTAIKDEEGQTYPLHLLLGQPAPQDTNNNN